MDGERTYNYRLSKVNALRKKPIYISEAKGSVLRPSLLSEILTSNVSKGNVS